MKVALSGLFGRFVARAYLERYFDLSISAHLGSRIIDLDRRKQVRIKRLSRGDLPDWIACPSKLLAYRTGEWEVPERLENCLDPADKARGDILCSFGRQGHPDFDEVGFGRFGLCIGTTTGPRCR